MMMEMLKRQQKQLEEIQSNLRKDIDLPGQKSKEAK
jgi:hypothetical protein